jgi:alpha-tubulin suppressor-like RCC1 family protein
MRRLVSVLVASTVAVLGACSGGGASDPASSTAPAGLNYSANPVVYTVGIPITANTPSSSGGSVTSYSVSPALPAGLTLNTATGVLSGTPTAAIPAAVYTVTASNSGGSATVGLSITVSAAVAPPSGLTYSTNPAVYALGTPIAANTPSSSGGAVTSYSVSPALPAGLSLNVLTGIISGTPTAVTPAAICTVTASNSAGSVTVSLSITVNAAAVPPAGLTYSTNPAVYTVGTPISANTPTSSGGAVTSYSVSPALPGGLSLNTSIGVISGNPTVVSPTSTYTVTATNSAGSTTAVLTITVDAPVVPPIASAGSTQRVPAGSNVLLDGTASSDSAGRALSYAWTLSAPLGSNALLSDSRSVTPSFTADVPGTYTATLTVSNGESTSSPSAVSIFCITDLRQLVEKRAWASAVWINGAAQSGSQFTLSITNISSNTTFPLIRVKFLNAGAVLWETTDPSLLNGNTLAPGQYASIVVTINAPLPVDFFNPIRFVYYLVDPATLQEFAVDAAFSMAGSDYPLSPISSVEVGLASATLDIRQTTQATTILRDSAGAILPGRTVTWRSTDTTVATIDHRGLVTATGSGSATITALSEGQSGSADIIVRVPAPVAAVTITKAGSAAFTVEQTKQFVAETRDAAGTLLAGRVVQWTTSDPAVATVSTGGIVTGVGSGSATITAASEGHTDTVQVDVVAFATLSAGSFTTCGISFSGTAYCWGWNWAGQLGDGTTNDRHTPTAVLGGVEYASVVTTRNSTCALDTLGSAYCWGYNFHLTPTLAQRDLSLSGLTAKDDWIYGLSSSGSAYHWYGLNPANAVQEEYAFENIAAALHHACGLAGEGAAYCWGANGAGQLGDESFVDSQRAVAVQGGHAFFSLAAGVDHTCGLTLDGAAYCWGANSTGALGDGTTNNRGTPTPVSRGLTFASIAAGGEQTCALTPSGAAYCWGSNTYGQLGQRGAPMSSTPSVVQGVPPFTSITVGLYTACGVTHAGAAYCWGDDRNGQLGGGYAGNVYYPTLVVR